MKKIVSAIGGYFKTTDYVLILFCMLCSSLSIVLLMGNEYLQTGNDKTVLTQVVASSAGLIAAIILSRISYLFIAKMWKLHVPLAILLVGLTFFIGKQTAGQQAWLEILGVGLQPSELMKISFIMSFAYHLSLVKDEMNSPKNMLLLCAHGAAPVLLISFQGDDGSALIFAFIFVIMIFAAGIAWKYIIMGVSAVVVALPVLWFGIMNTDQKMRFLAIFYPDDPKYETIFYQQKNAGISIGSGGVWGKGLFNTSHRYVPEMHNDFIFSFAGEAIGFVGCIAIIALLTIVCLKVLFNLRRCPDALGQSICVGVFAMLASQSIINLGMNLSVMPVIGVTLPFFSAGGSSVFSSYLGVGLVLSVYMYSSKGLFADNVGS